MLRLVAVAAAALRVRRSAWSSCWTRSCCLCRTAGLLLLFAASTGPSGPQVGESHASVQWGLLRQTRPHCSAAVLGKARSLPGYATEARNTRFRKTSHVVFDNPHATSCVSQPRRQAQWLAYDPTSPKKKIMLHKKSMTFCTLITSGIRCIPHVPYLGRP